MWPGIAACTPVSSRVRAARASVLVSTAGEAAERRPRTQPGHIGTKLAPMVKEPPGSSFAGTTALLLVLSLILANSAELDPADLIRRSTPPGVQLQEASVQRRGALANANATQPRGGPMCLQHEGSGCSCSQCCGPWLAEQALCDECYSAQCNTSAAAGLICADAHCSPKCLANCWRQVNPKGDEILPPCIQACANDDGVNVVLVGLSPFLLRMLAGWAAGSCANALSWWCERPKRGFTLQELAVSQPGFAGFKHAIRSNAMARRSAAEHPLPLNVPLLDHNAADVIPCSTMATQLVKAFLWLVLFHLSQPLGYFWLLWYYWEPGDGHAAGLDNLQKVFGVLVAIREFVYLSTALMCAVYKPAFLLIDVNATVRLRTEKGKNGMAFLAMYVLAPEKFIATVLVDGMQDRFDPVGSELRSTKSEETDQRELFDKIAEKDRAAVREIIPNLRTFQAMDSQLLKGYLSRKAGCVHRPCRRT
eukprot:COSAG02_NODE_12345_length_1559_cov_4.351370_1_plen_478_part_00